MATAAKIQGDRGQEVREGAAGDGSAKGATLNRLAMLFFGDDSAGVERATKALKFSNLDSAWIVAMARARREVGEAIDAALGAAGPALVAIDPALDAAQSAKSPEPAAIRRWVAKIGRTRTDTFCRLNGALHLARASALDPKTGAVVPDPVLAARLDEFRRGAVEIAYRDPIEMADLAVDGEDLRAAGVPAGPQMGRMLKVLLERVIDDPAMNTTAALLAIAKTLAAGA